MKRIFHHRLHAILLEDYYSKYLAARLTYCVQDVLKQTRIQLVCNFNSTENEMTNDTSFSMKQVNGINLLFNSK